MNQKDQKSSWKSIVVQSTVFLTLIGVCVFFMPRMSLATTGILLKEKVKSKGTTIIVDAIQEKLPEIVQSLPAKTNTIIGQTIKNIFVEFKIKTFINKFVLLKKEKGISSVIERVVLPENFQTITRVKIQPILSPRQIKNKMATIGGTILVVRGGSLIDMGANALLKKIIGNTGPSGDICREKKEPEKKNGIQEVLGAINLINFAGPFGPALALGVFVYTLGKNPPERGTKTKLGIFQRVKRGTNHIKSMIFGGENPDDIEDKKILENQKRKDSVFGQIAGMAMFFGRNKMPTFSAIFLILAAIVLKTTFFKDATLYSFLGDLKKGTFTFTQNLCQKTFEPEKIIISDLEEFEKIIQGPTNDIIGNLVETVYSWGQNKAHNNYELFDGGEKGTSE